MKAFLKRSVEGKRRKTDSSGGEPQTCPIRGNSAGVGDASYYDDINSELSDTRNLSGSLSGSESSETERDFDTESDGRRRSEEQLRDFKSPSWLLLLPQHRTDRHLIWDVTSDSTTEERGDIKCSFWVFTVDGLLEAKGKDSTRGPHLRRTRQQRD